MLHIMASSEMCRCVTRCTTYILWMWLCELRYQTVVYNSQMCICVCIRLTSRFPCVTVAARYTVYTLQYILVFLVCSQQIQVLSFHHWGASHEHTFTVRLVTLYKYIPFLGSCEWEMESEKCKALFMWSQGKAVFALGGWNHSIFEEHFFFPGGQDVARCIVIHISHYAGAL
jgi:hypothetical protein